MLINRTHIYIFGIPNHHRLMPCTRFLGVKRLPAEKVLKHTVGSADRRRKLHFQCASPQKPPNLDRVNCYGKPNVLFLHHFLRLKVQFYGLVLICAQLSIKARVEIGEGSCISNVPVLKSHLF